MKSFAILFYKIIKKNGLSINIAFSFSYQSSDMLPNTENAICQEIVNTLLFNSIYKIKNKFQILNDIILENYFLDYNLKNKYFNIFNKTQKFYLMFSKAINRYKIKKAKYLSNYVDLYFTPLIIDNNNNNNNNNNNKK